MSKLNFNPYKNESESIQLAGLTIENRLDRISIYGSIDLTKDKVGLDYVQELKKIIDQVLAELENSDLPDKVAIKMTQTVKNPFA